VHSRIISYSISQRDGACEAMDLKAFPCSAPCKLSNAGIQSTAYAQMVEYALVGLGSSAWLRQVTPQRISDEPPRAIFFFGGNARLFIIVARYTFRSAVTQATTADDTPGYAESWFS